MRLNDKNLSKKQIQGLFEQIKLYAVRVLQEIFPFITKQAELYSIHNFIKFSLRGKKKKTYSRIKL